MYLLFIYPIFTLFFLWLSGFSCSMGWIPSMKEFYSMLLKDSSSKRDVRIGWIRYKSCNSINSLLFVVRYEDFQRPNVLCRAIFKFIYNSTDSIEYKWTTVKVLQFTINHNHTSWITYHRYVIDTLPHKRLVFRVLKLNLCIRLLRRDDPLHPDICYSLPISLHSTHTTNIIDICDYATT